MICAHCGCENPNGIAYCRDCGMSLRTPAPRIAAPTPTPDVVAAAGYFGQAPASAPMQPQPPPPATPAPVAPPPTHQIAPAQPSIAAAPQLPTLRSDQVAPNSQTLPCPRCGEQSPEGSRFCHSCGAPLAAAPAPAPPVAAVQAPAPVAQVPSPLTTTAVSVVCSRCRGVADPGADFCKFCGARLGEGPISGPTSVSSQAAAVAANPPVAPAFTPPPPQAQQDQKPDLLTRPLHGIGDPVRADETVRARLVRIAKDGSEGAQHVVSADLTDIGRSEGHIILTDDPYLSPRHARIVSRPSAEPGGTSLILVDLGSVNGVFVRLRAPHPLTHGDLLLMGQQVLRFEAVTEIEGARGPAMQHGVLLFGSPAPTVRARLVQRTVEGLVRDVLYLAREEFVLGREGGDRSYPEDVFMSRRHAAVRREASGFVLHDLGSSNGTFVQIQGEHVLRDGDQFRVGHHLFRVDFQAPAPARPGERAS